MNTISLQQTLPDTFAERNTIVSDIWHQEVEFKKENYYLIEAASGTGKSSLCSFIYGYREDYQGIICFDGENIRKNTVVRWSEIRKRSVSMLFQDLRLFPELTAWENIQIKNTLTCHKSKKEIVSFFEAFDLADKVSIPVGKLSFGQQQRLALIRALCQPFDFIFLDEPVSHLDEENNRIMSEIILQEVKKQGAGVVVTSIGKRLEADYDKIFKL